MNKENVLYLIIGLLFGVIVGFAGTNYLNRTAATTQVAAVKPPSAPFAGQNKSPQVDDRVVRDQPASGGNVGNAPSAASGAALPQVRETLDKADKEPSNFDAQLAAGEMFYRIQNFGKAAEYYEKAAQLQTDNADVAVKTGNAYYDQAAAKMESGGDGTDNFKKAEKFYTQALAKDANNINVRTDLGLTFYYRQPKDLDRAMTEYQKSLQINPNHETTLQNLLIAQREKGDQTAAAQTLERLRKVNPSNPIAAQQ